MAATITWKDFENVDFRVGTILEVAEFPNARQPAYKLWIDFGELGILKSSAQITARYEKIDLIGLQIIAVVNFPKKQIADFMSECLVTGFPDANGDIILSTVEARLPNGAKLM